MQFITDGHRRFTSRDTTAGELGSPDIRIASFSSGGSAQAPAHWYEVGPSCGTSEAWHVIIRCIVII